MTRYILVAFTFFASASAFPQYIDTIAGGGPNGAPALEANMGSPYDMVRDASGNIFIAAASIHSILKVDTFGEATRFAGVGAPGFSGDGGPASNAALNFPRGLALDAAENLYISDANNNRIRRVDVGTGIITTIAGTTQGFSGDGFPATSAHLALPHGIAINALGDIYFADKSNERVRRISGGIITTVAGNGLTGSSGDGGQATSASLSGPAGVAVDDTGTFFVADSFNNKVRRVDGGTGIIARFAGTGTFGFSGDGGPAASAMVGQPNGVSLDAGGDLFIADTANHRIRRVSIGTGFITTVAGTTSGFAGDGGPAVAARLQSPQGVRAEAAGDYLVADTMNQRIRFVDGATSFITTVAGNGSAYFSGEGTPALDASFGLPSGVAVDGANNVFVADVNNHRIRRIDAGTGIITTVAGTGVFGDTGDGGLATSANIRVESNYNPIAVDPLGNIYFSQRNSNRVRRVDVATGVISAYAGNGIAGFFGDGGLATLARLNETAGLALDAADNLYIADRNNHRVRKVDFGTQQISTVAGDGFAGFFGDFGQATSASLNRPTGVAVDGAGHLYIGDANNNRVRKVDAGTGVITTIAGNGSSGVTGDGGPAIGAALQVSAIAVDPSGNLFVSSGTWYRVRFVDSSTSIITTRAGTGGLPGFSGDGGPAVNAVLNRPMGASVDSLGNFVFADSVNGRIRIVELSADLSITKDDGQTTVVAGGPIQYTITVTNNGPGVVSQVRVVDAVPPEILTPTYTPSMGSYDDATGAWTGLSLQPTDSVTLTLDGTLSAAASGTLVNSATVSPMGGVSDSNSANDTDNDVDTILQPAALSITKMVTPDPAIPGDTLIYDLSVTSSGPAPATNVVVVDTLPPDVTFQSAIPGAPTCTHALGVVTCNFATMGVPENQLITILVTANAPGTQFNSASVLADEPELDLSDNSDSVSSVVDLPGDAVRVFTARSTSTTNVLEWVNPNAGSYLSTEIVFNTSGFPANVGDGTSIFIGGSAGAKGTVPHGGLTDGTNYYYGAFVHLTGPAVSAGSFTKGRPFNSGGAVKWAYQTNATAMAPPSVGADAAYEVSNDQTLHAIGRGLSGGLWPPGYIPMPLNAPSQSRPPVVPTVLVVGATRVVFVGAQDGYVYAIDADSGSTLWQSSVQLGEVVQGSPVGMFTAFPNGSFDFLFSGTRSALADNAFYTLKVSDGTVVGSAYNNGGGANAIGIVSSGGSVDYQNDRVYFTSREKSGGSNETLWAFDITAGGLTYAWSRTIGDIDAAPVLFNGRLYVGTNASLVYAIDAASGADIWSVPFDCADGPVKGFIFPDFSSTALYLATSNKVLALSDDGTSASETWSLLSIPSPSTPLLTPGEPWLYVGSSDGAIYQLDLLSGPPPTITPLTLGDGTAGIGSPSLDVSNSMIYVGSEGGTVYGVAVPY